MYIASYTTLFLCTCSNSLKSQTYLLVVVVVLALSFKRGASFRKMENGKNYLVYSYLILWMVGCLELNIT